MIIRADAILADDKGTLYSPGAIKIGTSQGDPQKAGTILKIAHQDEILPGKDEQIHELGNSLLIPGLIQGHIHFNQTLFRGLAEGLELLPWLRTRIWPFEAAHSEASVHAAASLATAELLLGGTTAALTMETTRHTSGAFKAANALGIRAHIGTALMDSNQDGVPPAIIRDGSEALEETVELDREWSNKTGGRLRACVAPRFVLSCSESLLLESAEVAANSDLIWHTHVSENRDEVDVVRDITGYDNADYFAKLNLLGRNSSLAHGIWLSDGEIEKLADAGSSILHCPSTNLKMGSGIANTVKLDASGVNVALGSDGAPANNRLDSLQEMRLAALLADYRNGPSSEHSRRAFSWATTGGAAAMNLQDKIGKLRADYEADITSLSLDSFHGDLQSPDDLITWLVYEADSSCVTDVWVSGKKRVEKGTLVQGSLADIRKKFGEERAKLLSRVTV